MVGHRKSTTVVAQHEEVLGAEIGDESRLLVVHERYAFVTVIGEIGQHKDRLLRDGQYAALAH